MGENSFEFVLNDQFFGKIDGNVVKGGAANIALTLVKSETMYDLHFKLDGHVSVECDNCLDGFKLPLTNEFHLMMKLSDHEDYSDDEIIYITRGVIEFDLSQYLYESFVLSIPSRKVCSMANKTCNSEIADKINNFTETGEEGNNPLFDKLKGIFNNN